MHCRGDEWDFCICNFAGKLDTKPNPVSTSVIILGAAGKLLTARVVLGPLSFLCVADCTYQWCLTSSQDHNPNIWEILLEQDDVLDIVLLLILSSVYVSLSL